ncbi:helix-turn-helix domain-containing protein [Paenibacillus sp. GCM10027626]|uniref:helix-turn-helix domain-containing protein n=1 Tax=Paenibacillus sp. GCM10027626 TaxID=3273411 RepID=UPI003631A90F
MNMGSRIAKLREDRGWTQEQTAASLGISRAALSHYEKNRREPDSATLSKFADLFHVSVDYLVGRKIASPAGDPIYVLVDQLELSDEQSLKKFRLTIDGRQLTLEEVRRFIAFVRAERMME